jgi:hypothetical protein
MDQFLRSSGYLFFGLLAACSRSSFNSPSTANQNTTMQQESKNANAAIQPQPSEKIAGQVISDSSLGCPPVRAPVAAGVDPVDRKSVGSVLWKGTKETSSVVTLNGNSTSYLTTKERAMGNQVFSNPLPPVTATGWHLDVKLLNGFSSHKTGSDDENYVAWLGVSNSEEDVAWSSEAPIKFTGWYWIGTIWIPSFNGIKISQCQHDVLSAGTYRLAMRLESGTPKIYFRKNNEAPHGPYPVPNGELRLMMLSQGGYKFAAGEIQNSGNVYEGGGWLF